jgi:hypothetical protein
MLIGILENIASGKKESDAEQKENTHMLLNQTKILGKNGGKNE